MAVAASLLVLLVCVCGLAGASLASWFPSEMDRYLSLVPGQTSLYRALYADGSQGFATANVVRPSTNSLSYAAILGGGGQAVQIHNAFTNWQGTGQVYNRDDHYARQGSSLLAVAHEQGASTTLVEPALVAWAPALLSSNVESPLTGTATLDGTAVDYRAWRVADESLRLPDGETYTALRFETEWRYQDTLYSRSTDWYVAGIGLAQYEAYDGSNQRQLRLELLASTRLRRTPGAPIPLPLAELLAGAPQPAALFREDAARSGAHTETSLGEAELKLTYRLQTEAGYTASPVYAGGLVYAADQYGRLVAVDAYQAVPRWTFSAGGPMVAAPAVAGGIVYAGAGDKTLYALDAAQGMYLWSHRLFDNIATSPAIVDGTVYVGAEDRNLYALDALTGETRWTFTAGDRLVSSPAVADGRVVFGSDDGVVNALDASTGKLLWRAALDGAVEATPAVSPAGIVYAASNGSQLAALDAETGATLWTTTTRFGYLASPAVGTELVFDGDVGGTMRALDARTGRIAWEVRAAAEAPFAGSPLLIGDRLVAADTGGTLYVFEASTGQVLQSEDVGGPVTASPTWTGEAVLLANQKGDVLGFQASASAPSVSFTELWQRDFSTVSPDLVGASPYARPVVAGDRLLMVLRGGGLWSVETQTGSAEQLASFDGTVLGSPALDGQRLYVGTQSGRVIAYALDGAGTIWDTPLPGQIRFGPAVEAGRVFVHTLDGGATTAYALDASSGEILWSLAMTNGNSTPVPAGDQVIISGDAILGVDAAAGVERWRSEPFASLGSLMVAGNVVYAGGSSQNGVTFQALAAGTGQPLWQRSDPATFLYSRPAFDPGSSSVLAAASEGWIWAYAAQTGDVRWRFRVDAKVESDLVIADGVAYFTSGSGMFYAVDAATGRLLNSFRPGSAIVTNMSPVIVPGQAFTVQGLTLYALGLERR